MLVPAVTTAQPQPPPRDLVSASAEAVVRKAPDRVFVTVSAETTSKQSRDAQEQNAKVALAIRQSLARFNLADDAVRTVRVDLQPQFDWANGKQTLRGYLANNTTEVRLDDVTAVGDVIDAVIAAGATRVTGVNFTLKNMEAAEQEALKQASALALARARAMAEGVGRTIDTVVRIEEGSGQGPVPMPAPMMRMSAAVAEDAPSTPVTPGEVEVRVRVTLHASLR